MRALRALGQQVVRACRRRRRRTSCVRPPSAGRPSARRRRRRGRPPAPRRGGRRRPRRPRTSPGWPRSRRARSTVRSGSGTGSITTDRNANGDRRCGRGTCAGRSGEHATARGRDRGRTSPSSAGAARRPRCQVTAPSAATSADGRSATVRVAAAGRRDVRRAGPGRGRSAAAPGRAAGPAGRGDSRAEHRTPRRARRAPPGHRVARHTHSVTVADPSAPTHATREQRAHHRLGRHPDLGPRTVVAPGVATAPASRAGPPRTRPPPTGRAAAAPPAPPRRARDAAAPTASRCACRCPSRIRTAAPPSWARCCTSSGTSRAFSGTRKRRRPSSRPSTTSAGTPAAPRAPVPGAAPAAARRAPRRRTPRAAPPAGARRRTSGERVCRARPTRSAGTPSCGFRWSRSWRSRPRTRRRPRAAARPRRRQADPRRPRQIRDRAARAWVRTGAGPSGCRRHQCRLGTSAGGASLCSRRPYWLRPRCRPRRPRRPVPRGSGWPAPAGSAYRRRS